MTRPRALPWWLSLSLCAAASALAATLSSAAVTILTRPQPEPAALRASPAAPAAHARPERSAARGEAPREPLQPREVRSDEPRLEDGQALLARMESATAAREEVPREHALAMHGLIASLPPDLSAEMLDEWISAINDGRVDPKTIRP